MAWNNYEEYIDILKQELMPAMGCTEPIAVALAGATARDILGQNIERVEVAVSNNILKNVKSVVVPNTDGAKGIQSAVAIGIIAGKAESKLEVIADVDNSKILEFKSFIQKIPIKLLPAENDNIFDIVVRVYNGVNYASVRIADFHTNIVEIIHNGDIIFQNNVIHEGNEDSLYDLLNVRDIIYFIENVSLNKVEETIKRQISYNMAISFEGINGDYGANVGSTILNSYNSDVKIKATAMAAAGSDARMSGCKMPVIVVSGSGNQGITACVPVAVYCDELNISYDKKIRAVMLSDLLTIHLKTGIGRLSAYCGAISAGCAAGATLSYLNNGGYEGVAHTLVNSLAVVSGIVCDGAKPSCAGKIASAVEAGILGWLMYEKGQEFFAGDGIILKGVENTIDNIGRLGRIGMKSTDEEIVKMMIGIT